MTSILRIYKIREAKYDLVAAVIATALVLWIFSDTLVDSISTNLSTYTSVAATLLGFLLAAYALLLAFPKTGYLEAIKQHDNFPTIYRYFIFTLYITLLLLILSLGGHYINEEGIYYLYATIFLFVQIYPLILIFRIISLLHSMTEMLFKK